MCVCVCVYIHIDCVTVLFWINCTVIANKENCNCKIVIKRYENLSNIEK